GDGGADRLIVGRFVEPDHQVAAAGRREAGVAARAGAEPDVVGSVVAAAAGAHGAVVPAPAGLDPRRADRAHGHRQAAAAGAVAAVGAGEDVRVRGRRAVLAGAGLGLHHEFRPRTVLDRLRDRRDTPVVVLHQVVLGAADVSGVELPAQRSGAGRLGAAGGAAAGAARPRRAALHRDDAGQAEVVAAGRRGGAAGRDLDLHVDGRVGRRALGG